jgi:hypothetical protein
MVHAMEDYGSIQDQCALMEARTCMNPSHQKMLETWRRTVRATSVVLKNHGDHPSSSVTMGQVCE